MKRLLITGAGGFIGAHCLRLAEEAGGFDEIHAVGRALRVGAGRAVWHAADLLDAAQARALIESVKPTHLLHGAWIATPGVYLHSQENMDWLNSAAILARAFGAAGGRRFVGVGSSAEYAPGDEPCREDATPVRPVSLYGLSKAAAWQDIQTAAANHGFSAAWGRVFLPYGPGDNARRLIPSLVASLRAGQPIETTEGKQHRDFIFAPDVAGLLVRLLSGDAAGAFNVGTGRGVPVRQAIEMLADWLGASRDLLRFGARPLAKGEPTMLVADPGKVRETLGWSPTTRLEDGLAWAAANL